MLSATCIAELVDGAATASPKAALREEPPGSVACTAAAPPLAPHAGALCVDTHDTSDGWRAVERRRIDVDPGTVRA